MASTMMPLNQIDENLFTSPLSLRRHSISSANSCATPNSPGDPHTPNTTSPHTPKSEAGSSPVYNDNEFQNFMMRFQGLKSQYGSQSIAPNLLTMSNSHCDNHDASSLYDPHEDLLQPHQLEQIGQVFPQPLHSQPPQCNNQLQSMPYINDCSPPYQWGHENNPGAAAMTALQCAREKYEEDDEEMLDEDSQQSSPPPAVNYLPPLQQAPSKIRGQRRRRSTMRRTDQDEDDENDQEGGSYLVLISSANMPHMCKEKGCDGRFKRPEHLRRHERTHTQERPYKCDVRGCGRPFSRSDNLKAHRRTHMRPGGRNIYVAGLQML
ncbi:uncharacterized protein H6S33_012037 [Morchella sextelata]|uniref:uncharacterized protein n=1 Tax=Morchella sextelata TaxID=1174677 RepID=UPI001D04D73F|nr:uncharacterized protein H6S33_012037 [Morchella sextelata]KAH0610510.1 hypothetical protein H6S33_012037 [Morchella sextelata]